MTKIQCVIVITTSIKLVHQMFNQIAMQCHANMYFSLWVCVCLAGFKTLIKYAPEQSNCIDLKKPS